MADEFTTYDQVGMMEDVSDVISNIDPFDTPFQTLIGSKKVKARMTEWQEDSLAAASTMIAPAIEGAEYVNSARGATSMRSNMTEIRRLAFSVSETADAVGTYGRAKETALQLAKAGKELKRAYEVRLLSYDTPATDAVVGIDAVVGASDTARESGNVAGEGYDGDPMITNRSAATTSELEFTEAAFMAGMLTTYRAGAEGKVLMVSPEAAGMIDTWSTLPAARFRDIGQDKKMNLFVDLLQTRYGEVKVVVNRWLGYDIDGTVHTGNDANAALLFNPSYWNIGVLRPWNKIKLAKTSDSESYALRGEFTLMHRNYDEGFLWVNLAAPS